MFPVHEGEGGPQPCPGLTNQVPALGGDGGVKQAGNQVMEERNKGAER